MRLPFGCFPAKVLLPALSKLGAKMRELMSNFGAIGPRLPLSQVSGEQIVDRWRGVKMSWRGVKDTYRGANIAG